MGPGHATLSSLAVSDWNKFVEIIDKFAESLLPSQRDLTDQAGWTTQTERAVDYGDDKRIADGALSIGLSLRATFELAFTTSPKKDLAKIRKQFEQDSAQALNFGIVMIVNRSSADTVAALQEAFPQGLARLANNAGDGLNQIPLPWATQSQDARSWHHRAQLMQDKGFVVKGVDPRTGAPRDYVAVGRLRKLEVILIASEACEWSETMDDGYGGVCVAVSIPLSLCTRPFNAHQCPRKPT